VIAYKTGSRRNQCDWRDTIM